MPIMGVDDIYGVAPQNFQSGAAEESESLGVVGVVGLRCAVKILPVEIFLRAHEKDRDIFA